MITKAQATDPEYWVAHLRGTVRYADCITTLAQTPDRVFIEVGPGRALAALTGMHDDVTANQVINSLRHPDDTVADDAYFMAMLGRIWAVGGSFDWDQYWGEARRNRLTLPSYAFQRSPYFIEPSGARTDTDQQWLMRNDDIDSWGYRPVWKPAYADCDIDVAGDLKDAARETWLIFTDEAGLTDIIAEKLRGAGHPVTMVSAGDAFGRTGEDSYTIAPERGRESYDTLIRDLVARDRIPTRIVHGWLATAAENFRPGSNFFHRNLEQGFYSLLFLAQAIGDEDLTQPMHLSVLTTGAAQVLQEPLPYPEKATVMGPARVIPREFGGISCAVLDIILPEKPLTRLQAKSRTGMRNLALQVLEDLLAPPTNLTAALRGEKRYELSHRAQDISSPVTDTPPLRDNGIYLITGGFGGIGLTLARALIDKVSARIVLLSRSALPPRDNWDQLLHQSAPSDPIVRRIRAVQELEATGAVITYLQADVSNVEDMVAARTQIESELGPVNGVIHGAGRIDDGPILTKSMDGIEDVFTPKIHGTQVLDEVFPDGDLDWMVLFASTSTITAPVGQIDYVAANEYLNAYAKSRNRDKTRVMAINWGLWADVGMAADVMQARTGAIESVPVLSCSQPMLDEASFDAAGNRQFSAQYRVQDRWFLDDHRTRAGDALLPGTGYLELVAQALQAQGETAAFEICDLYFLRPLAVGDQSTRQIRLTLPRSDTGYDFLVESRETGAFEQNAQASLSLLPQPVPDRLDLDAIAGRCGAAQTAAQNGWLAAPQEAHLLFGPRWRVLQSTALGQGEGLARLALPADLTDDIADGYLLHPGLMDLATGWAMQLIADYHAAHLWVPVSYRSVRVFAPLPGEIVSWVRNSGENRSESEIASFDVTLCAPDGTVCVDIQGFSIRRMESVADFATPTTPEVLLLNQTDGAARPLSPAEERLRHNLTQGILAEEGAALFFRALATDQPQVILSSLDLAGLIEQAADQRGDGPGSDQKFQRPELDSDYLAPDNAIETRLAGFWQELLGVDQVGVEDSFFDLGGHSLIAVRLFAQIRKTWQVDFPISVLFEAPTIRKCAELIAARGVSTGTQENDGLQAPKKPERRFTHLVPMHSGEGGQKTPFFLVAGMFGNVLNLRHLAHLLGADRPFYGLQARGLYGDEDPHRSVIEAARDYIAEMRQVQPHGPYMVGGFSGGGIAAYEIAQQLTAAGDGGPGHAGHTAASTPAPDPA